MDARRWKSLLTFAAGCVSGAAILAWRLGDAELPAKPTGDASALQRVARQSVAAALPSPSPPPELSATGDRLTDPALRGVSPDVDESIAQVHSPGEEQSVADVLARLEAEYRERSARSEERKGSAVQREKASASDEATAPKTDAHVAAEASGNAAAPTKEAPAAVASAASEAPAHAEAPAAAISPDSNARVASAALASDTEPPATTATDPTLVALPTADLKALVDHIEQQRLSSELRKVAALQQATIVQQAALAQQFAVLQYLQLVSLTSNAPWPATPHASRRSGTGRIVDTLPSTFSASDNPWGFSYPAPVLLR